MYLPKHFEETKVDVLHQLIRAHPLGTWVVSDQQGLVVNHVPFMILPSDDGRGTLLGHVARANPVWQKLDGDHHGVVIFQGPQTYISPSWYPRKQLDGKVVPTWNYAVVHAHGRARAIQDKQALLKLVTRLTNTHEAALPAPWQVSDAPSDYVDGQLGAIVGIEIPISQLTGKWKNSQNRTPADRAGVVAGLGPGAALVPALEPGQD